ncbi:hypothetical protein GMA92_04170 [Turicibacter sanguinis]|uniref:Uncharacterized protein n=1 Tax=Turicibacter sanguinis TaxID=154288 RepID=A0A9X4XBZ4_9FIRM|nr:hypothetical protein [Turicibacter sanguinis]MTK72904.1 hypothetical protein [Turicibacter sanguinis]
MIQMIMLLTEIYLAVRLLMWITNCIKKIMKNVVSIVHDFYKVKEVVSANTSSEK